MTAAPLRAIAFDLFHTLVDPEEFRPPEFVRATEIARLIGAPVEAFTAAWERQNGERQVTMVPTVLDRARGLASEFGLAPDPRVWTSVNEVLTRYSDRALLHPRPGILRVLRQLRENGWTLGVISNCDESEMRAWSRSELAPIFTTARFSCEVGHAKPAREAFEALVPSWGGIPLGEAAFVGDGNNNELRGARDAGFARVIFQFQFVSVNRLRSAEANDRLRKDADTTISHLGELLELFPRPSVSGESSGSTPGSWRPARSDGRGANGR